MSVPKSMQPVFDSVEPLITDFCNQYLNDEYDEKTADDDMIQLKAETDAEKERLSSRPLSRMIP